MDESMSAPRIHPPQADILLEKLAQAQETGQGVGYLREGFQITDQADHFSLKDNEGSEQAEIRIRPGAIEYRATTGRPIFVDIGSDKPVIHAEEEEVTSLPFDVVQLAQDIIQRRLAQSPTHSKITEPIDTRIITTSSRFLYNFPQEIREALKGITNVHSLNELIEIVFKEKRDLTVLDIASGAGEFPLQLAKHAHELGIAKIVAADVDLDLMEPNADELNNFGVETKELDVNNDTEPDEKFDIVTLNAPLVQGEQAFAYQAIDKALASVAKPGLVLLRYNPDSGEEAMLEPKQVVPSRFPLFCFPSLDGYPQSRDTTYRGGPREGESANTYAVVNL